MNRNSTSLSCVAVLLLLGPTVVRADENAAQQIKFETHVAPILQLRCLKCHGEGKLEGGLDLRRKFTIVKGGDSGSAMVAGQPDESLLVQKIDKGEMPPAEEGRLDDKQRALIRRWVAAGAPLVAAQEPPLDETETPSRVSDEDRRFWSFQPPRRAPLPAVQIGRAHV